MATTEAVLTLGISMPIAMAGLAFGLRAARALYQSVAGLTCWPYL